MQLTKRFIIIDDDKIGSMLSQLVIESMEYKFDIQIFDTAEEAFEYIGNEYSGNEISTVLLLDINMPGWSGWDFLENFEKLDIKIKEQIKIYITSSSVDFVDVETAKSNINVKDFILKPLNRTIVSNIMEN